MKAAGFDLGNTLISYDKFPLNWQSLYAEVLGKVLEALNSEADHCKIDAGIEILKKYNSRINYRETEITSDIIFRELFSAWNIASTKDMCKAKQIFYGHFQTEASLYSDTFAALQLIKDKGIKVGVLTDVAYGMDREYIMKDLEPIADYIDVILTSTETGFRKPNPNSFLSMLEKLNVRPDEIIYVGDEEKDIVGANNLGIYSVLIDRKGNNTDYGQKLTIRSLLELKELFL